MNKVKRIALVAHDNRKKDLIEWVEYNYQTLLCHELISTGTIGSLVEKVILEKLDAEDHTHFSVRKLKSGPLGGDQQLGALIAEGKVDMLFFLWDSMQPQPHDVDVKALLRIAALYNIPTAMNRSTADILISSPLLSAHYKPIVKDYSDYIQRFQSPVDKEK